MKQSHSGVRADMRAKGGGSTVYGYCDNSVREKDWHYRKRGKQAT